MQVVDSSVIVRAVTTLDASERGLAGGAIYDCLIAQTAREHDAVLVSLDHRAAVRCSLIGAEHQLL